MQKTDLIEQVAAQLNRGKPEIAASVNAMLGIITEALSRNEPVTVLGFGTFDTRARPARAGRNPQTGAALEIPAANVVVFRVGAKLQHAGQPQSE